MPAVFLFEVSQFFGNTAPLPGGKLFTYAAGTTTPLASYTDSTGVTPATNPIVFDASGRVPAGIWITSAAYKFVLQDSAGATVQTIDGINISVPATGPFTSVTSTGDVTIQQSTPATSGANQSGNNLKIQGRYWTGSVDATDTWNVQDVLGTGSNPTSTLSLTHSGTSGATTFSVPGNVSVGGTLGVTGLSTLANVTETGTITQSGSTTVGKLNNTFYIDGTKYAQTDTGVKAALADAVTQGGGRVVIPDGVTITKTTQWILGNNTTKPPVELQIGAGATIADNTIGGVDSFAVGDGCGIVGIGGLPAANATFRPSQIKLSATTNINALLAPLDRTGAQEGLYARCFLVIGNASSTVASAIFDIQGIFINTYLENINTSTIPCKNLRIRAGTVVKICSDLMFYNCNFDCSNATGGIPVSIEGAAASEVGNITFLGGGIQHAGNTQALINIDGAGVANGAHHVAFIRVHLETAGTPGANTVIFKDTNHILFLNCRVSGVAATNIFAISQTGGGITHDINIQQLQTTGTPTNLINNSIDTTTVSTNTTGVGIDLYNYIFQGVQVLDNITNLVQSKAYVAAGDFTAGGIHLAPISPANGQMTALTFGASSGAGTYGGADFRDAFGGIYAEGSGAFGLKLHFATSNAFGSGAIFRWQMDAAGNLLAETDNAVDIGASGATRPRNLYLAGKATQYNAITTAGNGLASIYGATSQKVESAADANVLTFTPPAVAGTYRLSFVLSVSAAASAVVGWTATWKDSNGAAQSPANLSFIQSGTAGPALTFTTSAASNYYGEAHVDTDASATAIVIKFTLASGTVTAKASATIERIQ